MNSGKASDRATDSAALIIPAVYQTTGPDGAIRRQVSLVVFPAGSRWIDEALSQSASPLDMALSLSSGRMTDILFACADVTSGKLYVAGEQGAMRALADFYPMWHNALRRPRYVARLHAEESK